MLPCRRTLAAAVGVSGFVCDVGPSASLPVHSFVGCFEALGLALCHDVPCCAFVPAAAGGGHTDGAAG